MVEEESQSHTFLNPETGLATFHSRPIIVPSDPEQQMESRSSVSDTESNGGDVQELRSRPSRVSGARLVEPHSKLFGDCWRASLVVGGNIHSREAASVSCCVSSVAADCGPARREEPDAVLHS